MARTLGAATIGMLGLLLALAPTSVSAAPEAELALAPMITSPVDGAFIDRNTVTVRGAGTDAGNIVTIAVDGATGCTTAVIEDSAGSLLWECRIATIANGPNRVITATETVDDEQVTDRVTVNVLGAPTIDPIGLTAGIVSGTARPGATVQVTLPNNVGTCVATAANGPAWSCTPVTAGGERVPTGSYSVAARQAHVDTGASNLSSPASRTITIDTQPPAAPVILEPAGDYRLLSLPTTFIGTGEPGGSVDVYIDGIPVCSAPVDGAGSWSCVGGSALSNAAHEVIAIQRDAAGNHSPPSAAIRVFFGPAASAPRPQNPAPAPTPTPTPSETPEDMPVPSSPSPSVPGPTGFPTLPALSGDAGPDALTNWGSPTPFGDGLPSIKESYERGNWWRAPLLALAAIVLVALPGRLLASTLRGRISWQPAKLTGRNRPPVPASEAHTIGVNPWVAAALPFLVTVAFMVVAGGVRGEVRYLRLTIAVAIALGLINLVGVTIAARFGHLLQGIDGRVRFRPMLLVAAIASGLLSRIIGLAPPLVTGTLIGIRMPHETPVRGRATVNLMQVGSVLGLGVIGWVGHSRLGDVVGFWPSLLSELFAALCLVGIGSVLALLLPFGTLPGRVVWEWHRWLWFIIAMAAGTIAFAVLLGGAAANFPLATMILLAAGFAAACVAAWAWVRFVSPRA